MKYITKAYWRHHHWVYGMNNIHVKLCIRGREVAENTVVPHKLWKWVSCRSPLFSHSNISHGIWRTRKITLRHYRDLPYMLPGERFYSLEQFRRRFWDALRCLLHCFLKYLSGNTYILLATFITALQCIGPWSVSSPVRIENPDMPLDKKLHLL